MKNMSWINHPAMKNIDPRKLAVLVELIGDAEGKPLDKSLPSLMSANAKLKTMGLSFTAEETNLILEILTKDMSPSEKQKFNSMRVMMENVIQKNSKR
ncbi:hypothetical protein [Anaeromicropila herbilytica]|uniref:Uncharacterized protein n=1 Tax=Anaeromicropila herbilytica TaxID=2785025 RepID=A0A7R7ENH5_9FIRM|nr:hypothetical protein [Anaeromicropila herbilytica]BCN31994.1 hypothetical protein bsdtb5_32890 [Anaeromicropila herbilytica]